MTFFSHAATTVGRFCFAPLAFAHTLTHTHSFTLFLSLCYCIAFSRDKCGPRCGHQGLFRCRPFLPQEPKERAKRDDRDTQNATTIGGPPLIQSTTYSNFQISKLNFNTYLRTLVRVVRYSDRDSGVLRVTTERLA